MLWLEIKYANLLSSYLDVFKVQQTNPYLANFRCPLCGDSKKNRNKARGYLYTKKSKINYKCWNCGIGCSIGNLMKEINRPLYDQFRKERFFEYKTLGQEVPKDNDAIPKTEEIEKRIANEKILELMEPLTDEAKKYLMSRHIPEHQIKRFHYIANTAMIETVVPKYKGRLPKDERVILLHEIDGNIIGLTGRAIDPEGLRYVSLKWSKNDEFIFGLEAIDKTKNIQVVEGPIDSLFINNAVGVGGSDLRKIEKHAPKEKCVLIFDNDPRNKEVLKIMHKCVENDWAMVIWPDYIHEKDINDMVMSNYCVQDIINTNTYSGLKLRMAFDAWKKIQL